MRALVLLLFCGLAFADGATFMWPAKESDLVASEAQRMKLLRKNKQTVAASVVAVDPNALNSNVVNLSVGGKAYRFVGSRKVGADGYLIWRSEPTPGGWATLTRTTDGRIHGGINAADGRVYSLSGQGRHAILIELAPLDIREPALLDVLRGGKK